MKEWWFNIKNYEGFYRVSNLGRVKSLEHKVYSRWGCYRTVRERIKVPYKRGDYICVTLSKGQKKEGFSIHRLMMENIVPNPNNLPCINHKDEDKTNNFIYINDDGSINEELSNLEWCTHQYNLTYKDLRKVAAQKLSKPILQYTLEGEFVREWESARQVQKELGWSQGNIHMCLTGRRHKCHGFMWRYK